jgi:hypothetical protein
MPIFIGDVTNTSDRPSLGTDLDRATDGQGTITRTEPLITPEQLKDRFLTGIPLYAALPDPVTGIRYHITDTKLKEEFIPSAITDVEMDTRLFITPREISTRLPFDLNEYKSMGYFQLKDAPISEVIELYVSDSTLNPIFFVPTTWIEAGGLQKGRVAIIPLQPAFVGGGIVGSADSAGGAAFIALMGSRHWISDWWVIQYRAGFKEGRIPRAVNDVIGCRAAIDILSRLQATNRVASYGLGIDGASQNISTPGPQVYKVAMEDLEVKYKRLVGKLKALFGKKMFSSNV